MRHVMRILHVAFRVLQSQEARVTKLKVVILLVLAMIAIPAAHLAPAFAIAFWAVGAALPLAAILLIVRERRRMARER
ncbi:hypothetical protein B5P24_07915 [Clavibacter tessellarius]|uniref:Uncharacterized protein n=1 Tax=Clavibacter tessellarius TaxID=31965 RepID=A0A225CKJ0_9MICO|nr:hypothetical protein B5P24_07915 [Clavibacter michiganensis subsp. tessellarius]